WWAVLLVAVAIAGVAFAIGRFTAFDTSATTAATPATDSPEAGFARDMQVHHGQAVELAMDIYGETENDDVRVLAYDIATTQSAQRGEFYDWLVKWDLPQSGGPLMSWMDAADTSHHHGSAPAASDADLMTQMGMASPAEIAALRAETGTAPDCTFLRLMIRHHEGAVPMAEALVELGTDPRALQVAQGVIDTQSAEIDLMTALRAGLACSD
ncbi:DUF305 domain-containing protein, partial [Microbacterium sp.]|uniref:DUF305 domain-containing protein n=1 Tax=Microbacterium sp. TaxID=51671 RepID=UPI003C729D15